MADDDNCVDGGSVAMRTACADAVGAPARAVIESAARTAAAVDFMTVAVSPR
ncbi:hypothetical protein [Mycolicibacterium aromaticivorans]|uniref:hypothetical protein n=1 Tax=Mycolicibacterium aromaticivorans TaxID=318425 RepID=UPI00044C3D07|nr:hypothetical protein [Mycolicibacterium aromaticivorans]